MCWLCKMTMTLNTTTFCASRHACIYYLNVLFGKKRIITSRELSLLLTALFCSLKVEKKTAHEEIVSLKS